MTLPRIELEKNQQISLENAIIGACLLESRVYPSVKKLLQLEDFRKPLTKAVWMAMEVLDQKHYPIDLLTITEYLRFTQPQFLAHQILEQLTNRVNSSGNVLHWSFLLIELTFRRKAIAHLKSIQSKYPSIVSEMLDELQGIDSDIFEVLEAIKGYSDQIGGALSKTVDDFYVEMRGRIEEIHYQHPKLRANEF